LCKSSDFVYVIKIVYSYSAHSQRLQFSRHIISVTLAL